VASSFGKELKSTTLIPGYFCRKYCFQATAMLGEIISHLFRTKMTGFPSVPVIYLYSTGLKCSGANLQQGKVAWRARHRIISQHISLPNSYHTICHIISYAISYIISYLTSAIISRTSDISRTLHSCLHVSRFSSQYPNSWSRKNDCLYSYKNGH